MSITRFILGGSLLLSLTLACVSCGGDESGVKGEPVASGSFSDGAAPANTKVVVVWSVTSGSPDYPYNFGNASIDGGKFIVSTPGEPPAEAINSYGLGIGVLFLVDASTSIPEGKFDGDDFEDLLQGASNEHAIIWKSEDAAPADEWWDDFPAGYSCGACVPAPEGEVFDSFAPVDCSKLVIQVGSDVDVCNWT